MFKRQNEKKRKIVMVALSISILFVLLIFILIRCNEYKIKNECYYFDMHSGYQKIIVNFPKIYCLGTTNSIEKSNFLLRQGAFSAWGNTYENALIYLEGWQEGQNLGGAAEVEYEVLYLSQSCVSVVFDTLFMAGSTSTAHNLVSINLQAGKYILLDDITSIDNVLEAIRNGNFEVYEGTYSEFDEADAHKQDIIELMVQELEASLEKVPPEEGYDRYSVYNIGLDKEYLYLYISLPNIAFHDYMILCIPLEDVVE